MNRRSGVLREIVQDATDVVVVRQQAGDFASARLVDVTERLVVAAAPAKLRLEARDRSMQSRSAAELDLM